VCGFLNRPLVVRQAHHKLLELKSFSFILSNVKRHWQAYPVANATGVLKRRIRTLFFIINI